MNDRIEKTIDLDAPIDRVWRALTNHEEFGKWFRVDLNGPFVVGQETLGKVTYPGYEHLEWRAETLAMDPEKRFSFAWHPSAVEPNTDYSNEPKTVVEFTLESTPTGTRLHLVESGFSALPASRRDEAWRQNEKGWQEQMSNIQAHVEN